MSAVSGEAGQQRPFDGLTPEVILDAVESTGLTVSGGFLALNSYENRVYQVARDDAPPVVVKFYRPHRWSDEQIIEEHQFALELDALEIPVAAPIADRDGRTLGVHAGFRFATFERRRGNWPELATAEDRMQLGRFLGRIHAVGAVRPFLTRPRVDVAGMGEEPLAFLLSGGFVTDGVADSYAGAAEAVLSAARAAFTDCAPLGELRLHGDCHMGNILWSEAGPCFVDLDDARNGPAVQDFWMLLSGNRDEVHGQLLDLLDGYSTFHDFDPRETRLIEALRGLRFVYYSGWLARRWHDPAFPLAFPWFGTEGYWQQQVRTLQEQIERIEESPLVVD